MHLNVVKLTQATLFYEYVKDYYYQVTTIASPICYIALQTFY